MSVFLCTDLKPRLNNCLQHHQELEPPSCLATFCNISARRFVLWGGRPERLEPQKSGKQTTATTSLEERGSPLLLYIYICSICIHV